MSRHGTTSGADADDARAVPAIELAQNATSTTATNTFTVGLATLVHRGFRQTMTQVRRVGQRPGMMLRAAMGRLAPRCLRTFLIFDLFVTR
jgi:hypothetical protein